MEKENKIREMILLAALLHDIGKFYQRAGASRGAAADIRHECDGWHTAATWHEHVAWTARFLREQEAVFARLDCCRDVPADGPDGLRYLACCACLDDEALTPCAKLMREADRLSGGQADATVDETSAAYLQAHLQAMLCKVKRPAAQRPYYMPVAAMNLRTDSMPATSFAAAPDYASLWQAFVREFEKIDTDSSRIFGDTLMSLLMKYTCCVPADTAAMADVPLYDHAKTTAAIALCLYDNGTEGQQETLRLIGADFSGIQPYIYQIVSRYAGKNLKGRSFYLRLLSDAVVRYLLRTLHLSRANVVYNSGGGLYLLAPDTAALRQTLAQGIATVEERLLASTGLTLFVAIDSVPFPKQALLGTTGGEGLSSVWSRLFESRDKKKRTKFAAQIAANYDAFFSPAQRGGAAETDSITGEEIGAGVHACHSDGLTLSPLSAAQIETGRALKTTQVIVAKEGAPLTGLDKTVRVEPAGLGTTYYFVDDTRKLRTDMDELLTAAEETDIVTLNGTDGNCDFMHAGVADGLRRTLEFYGGNELADRSVPTFEDFCDSNDADSFKRLGVLRMDVDNLGSIFQSGLAAEEATLSRYAALSRAFDYFFSGYLNTIWRETAPAKSMIIYSGGDDIFIVGQWDVAIRLAEKINEAFATYACHNPALSLSGGVAVVSPKYPIMKAAAESAEEESAAKNHLCRQEAKNALSFMHCALNWQKEYPAVKQLKETLCRLRQAEVLPASFLGKVNSHWANSGMKNHKIGNVKSYWMVSYDMSRMKARCEDAEVKKVLQGFVDDLYGNNRTALYGAPVQTDYHPLELWAFACRWAELETRTEENS